MSAVLEEQQVTDPTAALAAVRDRLAKAREAEARWRRDSDRCAADIAKFQEQIAAVSSAESALVRLHQLRAAGEPITDKQLDLGDENLKSAQLLSNRAELAVQGAQQAAAHLADQLAEAQRAVATTLNEAKRYQQEVLRAATLQSREKFRAQAAAFIAGAYADHMATIVAAQEAARQLDLLAGINLPGPIFKVPFVVGSAYGAEPNTWKFDVSSEIDSRAAALLVSMLRPLAL
jgi:hypothetical protein